MPGPAGGTGSTHAAGDVVGPSGREGAVGLHRDRGAARDRRAGRRLLARLRRDRPRPRAAEPRAARQARRAAGEDRRLAPRLGGPDDPAAYQAFLREIGYLVPEGPAFTIDTANVDPEIAAIAGPQLVVPVIERPLRPQRRQRPLGLALRRALRHRRHPGAATAARAARLRPGARRRGRRLGPRLPRRRRAARRRRLARRAQLRRRRRTASPSTRRRRRTGLARPRRSSSATSATPTTRGSRCSRHHGLHIELVIDREHRGRRDRPRAASPTCCSRRRSPRSSTARTRSPPSTPRTRSPSTATGSA